jgi:hypothetical protein
MPSLELPTTTKAGRPYRAAGHDRISYGQSTGSGKMLQAGGRAAVLDNNTLALGGMSLGASSASGMTKAWMGMDERTPTLCQEFLGDWGTMSAAAERLACTTWQFAAHATFDVASSSGFMSHGSSSTKGVLVQKRHQQLTLDADVVQRTPKNPEAGHAAAVRTSPVGLWATGDRLSGSEQQPTRCLKATPVLSAVAMRSSSGDYCQTVAERALDLVEAGAYCHW